MLEFLLQRVERVHRGGIFDPFADVENGGRELAGLLRRNPGHLGVEPGEYRTDDAERCRGKIQKVAVAVHERLGVVIDIFGRTLVCDNKGVLVGVRRFDPGGEAIRQRELGLVFVDSPREFSRGRRRHPGLRDQQPLQTDGIEIVIGNRGRRGQHALRQRFLGDCGISSRQRFRFVDGVQGEGAALGILFIALVVHDRRGVRNRDRRAIAARREQFVERRIRRRQLDRGSGVGVIGNFQHFADERRVVVAVGQNRDLLFLQLRKRLDLFVGRAEQQHYVVLEDGQRPRAGRYLCVGAQHGKIGLPAIELRQRFAAIGVGHDFEAQL